MTIICCHFFFIFSNFPTSWCDNINILMISQIWYRYTRKGALNLNGELLGYLAYLNLQVLDGCCGVPLVVHCLFLKLGILSNYLFNSYFPICIFGSLLLILLWKLTLDVLLRLLLLLILILHWTLLFTIPLLIFL